MEKTKWWKSGAVLLTAGLLVACGNDAGSETNSSSSGEGDLAEEQVLNLIEIAELPTGDTALATDTVSFTVFNNINEGLYRLDKDSQPIPALAEEEVTVSEDGLEYTFKLREDTTWSNGDPVTANDFVYAWKRVVNPETAASYSYLFEGIENAKAIISGEADPETLGVEAVSDYELKVTMETPVPYFISLMAFPTFFPQNQAFVEEQGAEYGTSAETMVFNGPFTFSNWDGTNLNWTYEKNEEYWDAENVALEEINVEVIKETSTALNLYDSGQIDRVNLTGEFAKQYQDNADYTVETEARTSYLQLNQEKNGEETPLANENLRKAIASSYNHELLVSEILANGSQTVGGLVPAELAANPTTGDDFRSESGDYLAFDADAANEYWESAKEELGTDTVTLELLGDDDETNKKVGAYMKDQIETNLPGVEITLKNVPFKARLELQTQQDYDLALGGWGADFADPVNFIDLMTSESPYNRSSYSNAEFDELVALSKGENATDVDARWTNLLDAEKILLEEAGVAPLFQRAAATLQKDYVKDVYNYQVGAKYSYKDAYIEAH
ncbi:peptide ABC transporter substrate-binding protein [Carnobacterium pleistocenium]|uniref:peptide ABC transporter substrate-binding protein n=1 Tax=Carnobacterium pleistocenium TaxID=181073 RepID=UPI0005583454|nr:peptide ABC transporter substrate-binding protein [Carnobacterium pleistocenium]